MRAKAKFPLALKKYLRENLGAPFIIVFQVLLLVCAGLLVLGNSMWAEEVAVGAYFSLVVGVVLQSISFLRHGKRREERNKE